ncbi:MAG: hypothetical protein N3G80_03965 [Candidatus Micrarchaeota archaeon]|nr:hypothetical protein [Candidatus Micrarchaeota archaeon]
MSSKKTKKKGISPKQKEIDEEVIKVKRNSYSKKLRYAVLASAQIRQKLIEMGGENTIDVIREFDKDMTDEELAKKIAVKASDVRVVLNRLHSYGLFTYTRVKDKDSGWYTYVWRLREDKLREFAQPQQEMGEVAEEYEGEIYYCPSCQPKKFVTFEEATVGEFRCQNCGKGLVFFERKEE